MAEIQTSTGRYFWVPWKSIQAIEFSKPERPFDLLWRKASVSVAHGPDGEIYMPVRYPSPQGWSVDAKMGRATDWHECCEGFFTGVGQKIFLVGDQEISILEMESLVLQVESNKAQ